MAGLGGVRVVVTAGGTREPIDPVRFLGNRSSGKMGNALAVEATRRGAEVVLITAAPHPVDVERVVEVETAAEMEAAVRDALTPGAVLIMAAAVADYRPAQRASQKIKKRSQGLTLELVPTTDILLSLARDSMRDRLYVVGFAAETENVVRGGQEKALAKRLDLCVINDVSQPGIGMGTDDNAVTIVDRSGLVAEVSRAPKSTVARAILDIIEERYGTTFAAPDET
jgi:phosphopantothenoylcysteine decarboxylase/phosphopantothenate--cysteine ligase